MDTITVLFANAVKRFPDRPALLEPAEESGKNKGELTTLTYVQLQQQAEQFAGYLQQQQVSKGERLLIWSASRINWMVAYLGSLLVGAVVVPLDVSSKEDFLTRIAQTTEAKYLITSSKQYQELGNPPVPLIDIDALPAGELDRSQLPEVGAHDLAELVFTSGTTGQPKGVMLSHGNIASNAQAALGVVDIRENDRALSILPLSHMFEATIDIAILSRGSSVLYARSLVPDTLLRLLGSQGVTLMVLVPQALQLFLHGIEREVRRQKKEKAFEFLHRLAPSLPFSWRRRLFTSVHKRFGGHFKFFISGGAYLPPKLAERWENMGFRIMQGYGTTECAPVVSVTPYREHVYGTAGKSLPGQQIRIAEDGEIQVHGANVALGYWKNPEATAAAFHDGWYSTGDLGYLDERGFLYIKGRKKNLIVLPNGLNVYPEDVENVLLTNVAIKDAVVIGMPENGNSQEQSVHAVLLMDNPEQAKAAIQQANKQLASHQQIRGFTIWPETDFPRTHTLKVKRPELLEKLATVRASSK
ncbi:MAG TPA: AMP-binding protein [Ktedonobacteraceae bacterium]|nr:AMP-binding protein [Ktedonobacteraceae bacterium]